MAVTAARDMWRLDEGRIQELNSYGIQNTRLTVLHDKAGAIRRLTVL